MQLRYFPLSLFTVITVQAAVVPESTRDSNVTASMLNATYPFTSDSSIPTSPVNTQVFPPGYPKTPYRYQVRSSTITLACVFRWKPRIKQYQVNAVLQKSIMHYGDPEQRNDLVYKGVARAWDVHKSDENEGATYLTIRVNVRNRREMTYRQAINALIGVNQIRLEYPELDMGCRIHNIDKGRDVDLGDIELYYDPRANPYLVSEA
ncbi:MAG: hypothetical protein Q9168_001200 [Polycauliona sp. 1 TL-2023]